MKKIMWVADYSLQDHKGGAQQTNKEMIEYGLNLGYDIDIVLGGSVIPSTRKYDLIVINNITLWERSVVESLVASGKVIRYEHDLWVARNYPDLYKKVKHTIFLSPLHKQAVEELVGYRMENCSLVPSPIDVNKYKVKGEKEPNTVLWAGNFCESKGSVGFMEYAKENPWMKFYVAGWGEDIKKVPENMKYLGELSTDELIKEYQRCEYFYHKPFDYKEPFGRTVVEAYLCGCNLLLNNKIGAISWDWDYSNYDLIKEKVQSQSNFWKVLKDEVQTSGDME